MPTGTMSGAAYEGSDIATGSQTPEGVTTPQASGINEDMGGNDKASNNGTEDRTAEG